jgi:hypothetical protein
VSFSPAQYETIIEKLAEGHSNLPSVVQAALNRYDVEFGFLGGLVGGFGELHNNVMSKLGEFLEKVGYYLAGSVRIPLDMHNYAGTWQGVEAWAGTMAAQIRGELDTSQWAGIAGGVYSNAVQMQSSAVTQVQSHASNVVRACNEIAAAGLGFYAALLAAVTSILTECAEDVPTPWGIAAIIANGITLEGQAALNLVTGLKTAIDDLGTVLGQDGNLPDYPSFPNGAWPQVPPPDPTAS